MITRFSKVDRLSSPALVQRFAAVVTAALVAGSLSAPAAAEPESDAQPTAEQQQMIQDFRQARAKIQRLKKQLGAIQEAALEENPELEEQQEAFEDMVVEAMKEDGYAPEKEMNRIKELKAKIENDDLPKAERQEHFQAYREKVSAFQQAQQQAMQSQAVRDAAEQLNTAMMTAMQEQDPQTRTLLEEIQQAEQTIREIQQSAMRGRQGAPQQ